MVEPQPKAARLLARAGWPLAIFATLLAACRSGSGPEIHTVAGVAQGTTYSLQWIGGAGEAEVASAAAAELERIDALLSTYRPDSALERFNANRSTERAELPAELVALLELAKRIHDASDGCFDPTVRPLVRAWGFDADAPAVPEPATLAAARAAVGLAKLELLDSTHVRKTVPELELDMSSIGQGYTADRLGALLERLGSTAYLAEIGGEIVARGAKPDGSAWRIGVENPVSDAVAGPALRVPSERHTAVVTSGSYRHFLEADGRRYSHIIDPRSGAPVQHELLSVTVVGTEGATAAAWGTALLCLGPGEAAAAADREGVAALLWRAGEGDGAVLEQTATFAADWQHQLDGGPRP